MKPRLIVFDLDGTLADTSPGIINSHKFANLKMGRQVPDDETLAKVIGGPLLETYKKKFSYSDSDAVEAVRIYRERYATHGINEVEIYSEIPELLKELKSRGFMLAVATLKAEKFAIPMLTALGVAQYFDLIHGVDDKDTRTKSFLIELCMSELNVSKEETILVGDSSHDAIGAQSAGVGFVAALYGFGFKTKSDVAFFSSLGSIETPKKLLELL